MLFSIIFFTIVILRREKDGRNWVYAGAIVSFFITRGQYINDSYATNGDISPGGLGWFAPVLALAETAAVGFLLLAVAKRWGNRYAFLVLFFYALLRVSIFAFMIK